MGKKQISNELIENIIRLKEIGLSNYAIAKKYGISPLTVKRYFEEFSKSQVKKETISDASNTIINGPLNTMSNARINDVTGTSIRNVDLSNNANFKISENGSLTTLENEKKSDSNDAQLSRVSKQLDPIIREIYDLLFGGFQNFPMKTAYEILKKKYKLTVSLNSFKLYVRKNKEKILQQSIYFTADMPRILK